ncbi:MAG: PIN domain-containing protein [Burkholderiales bacterium]|nr:PIN domain-containing protein [Burkholderiales bacterium]
MTPDVNVLVAAFRADHPHHRAAAGWLRERIDEGTPLAVVPTVVASFLRLVTSRRVFPDAAPAARAVEFVDALLAQPGARWAAAQEEWRSLRGLCLERRLAGNDVPDAWLAASVIGLGEHLVTFDAGFRRMLPRRQLTILGAR